MRSMKPVLSGTIGTSMMTLFSYYVSKSRDKNFKEPKLLAEMVDKVIKEEKVATISGWAMHYTMGILLATAFNTYWQKTHIKPGLGQLLMAGISSGAFGIEMWKLVFCIHPNPPKIPYRRYYKHLVLAHLVFSAGIVVVKRLGKTSSVPHGS